MGCQNSKTMETQQRDQEQMDFMAQQGANNIPGEGNNDQQYEDEYNEDGPPPLTAEEIKSRIIAGNGSMFLPDFTYSLKYAWQSQRGYYPESPNKANQDACLIVKNFGKNQNIGYFGVYDGHGAFGDKCSGYVRSKISTLMLQSIAKTPAVNDPSFDRKFGAAHEKCNEMMHQASSFDDSSSGTTAVSVWIEGTTVKVANLGDSRAIVAARQSNGKLKAIALSQDQTPYRQDERERCKKTGCRVLTMDQLEGYAPTGPEYENWGVNLGEEIDDGGDPPRIWHPTKPFPGTAFTRSIGDHVAEALGVFATPEILSFDLDSSHEFIVVASDGVWEFLTSQSVVDMVASYKDPSEACRVVVHESYTLWLRHEVRTDDITMIVIQIKGLKKGSSETSRNQLRNSIVQRPVRRRRKRDVVAGNDPDANKYAAEDAEEYDITANAIPKTKDELKRLKSAVKSNFLFIHLDDLQLSNIFSVMQRFEVKKGDTIIKQGDDGDKFYVVDEGRFDVFVTTDNGKSQANVLTYNGQGSFGELSLMYGKPRAATIVAQTNGVLWSLERRAFRRLVMKSSAKSLMGTLKSVEILKSLKQTQIVALADALSEVKYKSGESVITQGEVGEKFFVIQKGSVKCVVDPGNGEKAKEVLRLGAGSYFGERALLSNNPRAASVIAVSALTCLQISREAFENVLGPLASLIEEDQKRRESRGRKVTRKASIQVKGNLIQDIQQSSHFDYSFVDTWFADSGGFTNDVSIVRHNRGKEFNMRRFNKCNVKNQNLSSKVLRCKELMASLGASNNSNRNIADLLATYVDENCLWMLLGGSVPVMFTDFYNLMNEADGGQVLSENNARFYAGCIINALESLHQQNIIYRMIDSQQIAVDINGYLVLYDFMNAKNLSEDGRTSTLCGTKEYFAPEQVSSGNGHGLNVDIWHLGIFIYELINGTTPFSSDDVQDGGEKGMYDRIIAHKAGSLKSTQSDISKECLDFINKLVVPKDEKRLKSNKLASHSWFNDFNIDDLKQGRMSAPFEDIVRKLMQKIYSGKSSVGERKGKGGRNKVATVPYLGDSDWFDGF